jgi:hypothetical protein
MATGTVAAVERVAVPSGLVAVTSARICEPTSAGTRRYVATVPGPRKGVQTPVSGAQRSQR